MPEKKFSLYEPDSPSLIFQQIAVEDNVIQKSRRSNGLAKVLSLGLKAPTGYATGCKQASGKRFTRRIGTDGKGTDEEIGGVNISGCERHGKEKRFGRENE